MEKRNDRQKNDSTITTREAQPAGARMKPVPHHRGGLVEVLDTLWRSGWLILHRGSPGQIPRSWFALVSVVSLWTMCSAWSDVQGHHANWSRGVTSASLEVVIWTILLYATCHVTKRRERFHQAWISLSGIFALKWFLAGVLITAGIPSSVLFLLLVSIVISGYGYILESLDAHIKSPYLHAGQALILSWLLFYLVSVGLLGIEFPAAEESREINSSVMDLPYMGAK